MAKKTTKPDVAKTTTAKVPVAEVVTTPVRNTAIPPKSVAMVAAAAPAKKAAPTYDDVALRAFLIWRENGGSEFENWIRAERELSI